MTYVPSAPPTRLSKSSLTSFIFVLLICIPFGGALAILMAIIGFIRSGAPGVRGRWMAVVGGILGLVSLVTWILGSGVIIALVYTAMGLVKPPMNATHDFVRDLTAGDIKAVMDKNPGWDQAKLNEFHDALAKKGTFVDTAFDDFKLTDQNCHLGGTAKFSNGTLQIEATLVKDGEKWEVKEFIIHNP